VRVARIVAAPESIGPGASLHAKGFQFNLIVRSRKALETPQASLE